MAAVVHGPGGGETLDMGPITVVIKAGSEATGGGLFLSEVTLAAGTTGPPPHVHSTLHDMFYVLEGVLTVRLDEEERAADAGTFVCAPPGTVHTFRNASEHRVRFLNFNVPGGFERYMRDLAGAAASGTPMTPAAIGRIASGYDIRVV